MQEFGSRINNLKIFLLCFSILGCIFLFSPLFLLLSQDSPKEIKQDFSENENKTQDINIFKPVDEKEGKILLRIARESIQSYVSTKEIPEFSPEIDVLKESRGVFVTLYENGNLRGCIGTHVGTEPLYKLLPYIAIQSAFYDRRFRPVAKEELKDIKIELSIYLSGIVKIDDISKYKVGEYGIIIRSGLHSATFLPKVPLEQGWDKTKTLEELCLKAGLSPDSWKDTDAEFYIYSVQVIKE